MAKKIGKLGSTDSSFSKVETSVRKTTVPRSTPRPITHEMIAKRAYEIWKSGTGGSDLDNWLRAERELRSLQG